MNGVMLLTQMHVQVLHVPCFLVKTRDFLPLIILIEPLLQSIFL